VQHVVTFLHSYTHTYTHTHTHTDTERERHTHIKHTYTTHTYRPQTHIHILTYTHSQSLIPRTNSWLNTHTHIYHSTYTRFIYHNNTQQITQKHTTTSTYTTTHIFTQHPHWHIGTEKRSTPTPHPITTHNTHISHIHK